MRAGLGSSFGADEASKIFLKRIGLLGAFSYDSSFFSIFFSGSLADSSPLLGFPSAFAASSFDATAFSLFATFDSLTSSEGFSLTAVFFLVVLGLASAFSAFTSAFTSLSTVTFTSDFAFTSSTSPSVDSALRDIGFPTGALGLCAKSLLIIGTALILGLLLFLSDFESSPFSLLIVSFNLSASF